MTTQESSADTTACNALGRIREPTLVLDTTGTVTYANDAASELLRSGTLALVEQTAHDLFADRFGERAGETLRRSTETGEAARFEAVHDPSGRRFEVRVYPDQDGTTLCLRDRSDAAPDVLSEAVDVAAAGVAVLEDGEYVYTNRLHAEMFGFEPSELVGSSWKRIYSEAEREEIEATVLPTVESEGRWAGELIGRDRDGGDVHQEVELETLDDGRLVCTSRDVSARKERERTASRQRTRLRALFDKSPDGIVVHDADGRVEDVNETECETLGIDRETLLAMNVAEFEVGHDREELQELWAEMDEGDVLKVEGNHRRRDGEVFPVEVWVNKVDVDGSDRYIAVDREITDRKRRERELERTKEFLERTQATASIGGWETDLREGTLRWTDEVYRIHGLPTDADVSVDDALECYHPDDRQTMRDALDRLTEEGEAYDVEVRITTADDDVRWIRSVGEPQFDDDEAVVGAIGMFQDITERVEQREELREIKNRLDLAVDGAGLGIWDWDMRTDAVEFNDQWAEMLGLSPDDIDSHLETWESRVHPDDMDRVEAELNAHVAGDAPLYDCEHRMRTADGEWKWIRDAGKVVERTEEGEPVRAVGIHLDVSDRREYEETLERTRSELRQIIDLVPDLIFAKDEDGRYLLANETTADAYGMDPASVEGKTESEIIPDADQSDDFREDDLHVMESGEPLDIPEEELTTADGETRIFRTTKIPYTVAGSDNPAVLGYARDITELKAYEQTLESQRDNLGVLNQIVRHDIQNNLNIVVGYAEFLEEHVDDAGTEYLDTVLRAAREAIGITTSAREVTELLLEADGTLSRTDVTCVLRDRIGDLQSSHPDAEIAIVGQLPEASVRADDMLGSVFRNLIQNAVLHNDANSPEIGVSMAVTADRVRIEVADNGPGIPDDMRDVIFEQGTQGLDSEGTGLGLYLVQTLVDRYDGVVRAEDNDRGGTTFVVEFPLADSSRNE